MHGVYTGLCPIPIGSLAGIQSFINDVTSSSFPYVDGIVAGYMCPFEPLTYDTYEITWGFTLPKHYTALAGYVPKNKKLFTAPYNVLRIVTDSDSEIYPYEYFSNASNCEFNMLGYFLPEPVLSLVPKNFKSHSARSYCLENRMTIKEFPQIAIDADVWKVYFAQHGASLITSMIGDTIGVGTSALAMASGAMTPESTLGMASSLTGIAKSLAQVYEIQKRPPELKGTQSSLSDYSIGAKRFFAEQLCIRPEFARIIDDYFTMFGYATHRVKIPNITGRPYWNYVKTKGIVLDVANAPQPYIQKLIECFNRGITFWHNPAYVGRYDLDNSPTP